MRVRVDSIAAIMVYKKAHVRNQDVRAKGNPEHASFKINVFQALTYTRIPISLCPMVSSGVSPMTFLTA